MTIQYITQSLTFYISLIIVYVMQRCHGKQHMLTMILPLKGLDDQESREEISEEEVDYPAHLH